MQSTRRRRLRPLQNTIAISSLEEAEKKRRQQMLRQQRRRAKKEYQDAKEQRNQRDRARRMKRLQCASEEKSEALRNSLRIANARYAREFRARAKAAAAAKHRT
jgi:hypothetical protein